MFGCFRPFIFCSANVIVSSNLVCKLTDFGCSIVLKTSPLINQKDNQIQNVNRYEDNRWTAGTWFYRAPELFRYETPHHKYNDDVVTFKCDIYSLAIVMWQLLTRESPYHEYHEDNQVIVYQIVTKNLRPQFPKIPVNNLSSSETNDSFLSKKYLSSSSSFSSLNSSQFSFDNKEKISSKSLSSNINADILVHTRSTSNSIKNTSMFKLEPDNTAFEIIYRNLIEQLWDDDPKKRFDIKKTKEILFNTKISY